MRLKFFSTWEGWRKDGFVAPRHTFLNHKFSWKFVLIMIKLRVGNFRINFHDLTSDLILAIQVWRIFHLPRLVLLLSKLEIWPRKLWIVPLSVLLYHLWFEELMLFFRIWNQFRYHCVNWRYTGSISSRIWLHQIFNELSVIIVIVIIMAVLRKLMGGAVRFFSPRYHIIPKWAPVPWKTVERPSHLCGIWGH